MRSSGWSSDVFSSDLDSHPRGHEEPGRQAALAIPGWLHEQIGNRPAAADVDHMPSDRVPILRHAAAHPLPGVIDQDFAHFWHRRKIALVDAAPDPDPFTLFRGRDAQFKHQRTEERRVGKGWFSTCRIRVLPYHAHKITFYIPHHRFTY